MFELVVLIALLETKLGQTMADNHFLRGLY